MSHIFPTHDRTAWVSPTFSDNENAYQFSTIQAAIDFVYAKWGPITDPTNKAVIKVGPGIYEEQIHSYDNIVITSYTSGFEPLDTEPPATIYNTGVDSAHYPLRSDGDENYIMTGMTIKTDADKVYGIIPEGNFYSCRFNNGDFIERDSSNLIIFSDCAFNGGLHAGFHLVGTNLTGNRNIILRNCNIKFELTPTLTSTHVGWTNFKLTNVDVEGTVNIGGDWEFRSDKSYFYRQIARNTFSTTASVDIVNTVMINGMHFTSAPASFKMIDSSFEGISDNKIPDGEADITSDVTITNAEYHNNIQHNGISGKIQIVCPIKAVGCRALNRYFSLQDAIDSIAVKGTVDLWESLTGLPELTINANTNVTIEGHKTYSLTFDNDIVELGADAELVFYALTNIIGGHIEVNGNNAYVGFEECLTVNAYVLMTSGTGSYCLVYTSTIKAPAGQNGITINNTDGTIVIGYSRVDGGTGKPAIWFTVEADERLKAKYSTFLHGDGGANSPINRTENFTVTTSIYLCAGNASLTPAGIGNDITGSGNTNDGNIDF